MRTIKLVMEYDGTNYHGWQVQSKGQTVQGIIEEKLKTLTREDIHLIGSGRTDAGAHALDQVAHFKTESKIVVPSIQRALNSLLPYDIVIKKVMEVEEDFHARKKSKSKIYKYQILNRSIRSPFLFKYTWHIPQKLDIEKMKEATRWLIGERDFSSFRSVGTPTRTAIRRVIQAEWMRGRNGLICFEIEANGFLKQMVRAIVGTLVEVGRGRISPDEFLGILESKDRKKAGPTAPAQGLFLKEVKY